MKEEVKRRREEKSKGYKTWIVNNSLFHVPSSICVGFCWLLHECEKVGERKDEKSRPSSPSDGPMLHWSRSVRVPKSDLGCHDNARGSGSKRDRKLAVGKAFSPETKVRVERERSGSKERRVMDDGWLVARTRQVGGKRTPAVWPLKSIEARKPPAERVLQRRESGPVDDDQFRFQRTETESSAEISRCRLDIAFRRCISISDAVGN